MTRSTPNEPALAPSLVLELHETRGGRGRRQLRTGRTPAQVSVGRVPRVARMMALALHWQGLIRSGAAGDQAGLARLVGVSRARITQVMDLLRLAPDIQEALLDLPRTTRGRDPVHHRDLVRIASEPVWEAQRKSWEAVRVPIRSPV